MSLDRIFNKSVAKTYSVMCRLPLFVRLSNIIDGQTDRQMNVMFVYDKRDMSRQKSKPFVVRLPRYLTMLVCYMIIILQMLINEQYLAGSGRR